jgi:hypothetical protein
MPYHHWNDDTFDWKALDKGMTIISNICKFARIGVHMKEKYGSARINVYFFDGTLHSLVYPGYVYNQFPKWLFEFDNNIIQSFFLKTKLVYILRYIQYPFHMLAYYIAMSKYPHIRDELCYQSDYPELIYGGKDIHNKYWKEM